MSEEITLQEYQAAYRKVFQRDCLAGFYCHLVAYIFINILLIGANIVTYVKSYLAVIWFFFPLLGWGTGLTIHYLVVFKWFDFIMDRYEVHAEAIVRRTKKDSLATDDRV